MKTVAILQSNYIPWKGYFDLLNYVDEFIIYDTVQFTKNDWRNRNRIMTPRGPMWLTIPVSHHFGQCIQDTRVSDLGWARRHWKTIVQNYCTSAYFSDFRGAFEALYANCDETRLSVINRGFICAICAILGINTRISSAADYTVAGNQTERLVSLCQQAGADEYLSGPAARNYLNEPLFDIAGIKVRYIDYGGYPPYRQVYEPFEHGVTILDLIFNQGMDAHRFMKSFAGIAPDQPWDASRCH